MSEAIETFGSASFVLGDRSALVVSSGSSVVVPDTPASGSYWVLEEDGTSKWTLEEGGGFWITEEGS